MNCEDELLSRVKTVSQSVPYGTILCCLTDDVLEMVRSYRADGLSFLKSGDPVNSLASFAYALGWLDAGCCMGLFSTGVYAREWPFSIQPLPLEAVEKLDEKASRYGSLLARGRAAIAIAPDEDTCLAEAAARVLFAVKVLDSWGRMNLESGKVECALALFSYAFGWLDAGVRIGLFHVTDDHDIFTV